MLAKKKATIDSILAQNLSKAPELRKQCLFKVNVAKRVAI